MPKKSETEKLAEIIRAKLTQGLTLTLEENKFLKEQQEENRRDDNPYRH